MATLGPRDPRLLYNASGQAIGSKAPTASRAPIQASGPNSQYASNPGNFTPRGGGQAPGAGYNLNSQGTRVATDVNAGNSGGAPMQENPAFQAPDYDSIINPVLQALDSAIAPLQQGYETDVAGIGQRKQTAIQSTNQQIGEQSATLGRNRESQISEGESSVNEQRRGLSEINQGLQAKYGAGTGTGAFAAEYAGGQALRNIGNLRSTLSQNLQAIDDKLQQVKEIGRIALMDVEDKAADQIRQSKAQLDQNLQQIRMQKGELQSKKAELAANAMQLYQQTVNQINASNTAFKQQLYAQQLAAENSLKQALKTGQGAIGQLTLGSLKGPLGQVVQGGLNTKTNQFYELGSQEAFPIKSGSSFASSSTKDDEDSLF